MTSRRSLLTFAAASLLAGCADPYQDPEIATGGHGNLGQLTYSAVDRLLFMAPSVSPTTPIIVASITDTEQLEQAARFGNVIADLARSRLAQRHMTVSDERLRSAMLFKPDQGEMMLARDAKSVVPPPNYAVVLTGTYAPGPSQVIVGLKLMSAGNARILSAVDFVVWRSENVSSLLYG